MRVLLIEDDELIAAGILAGLRAQGITVYHAADAKMAEHIQRDESFDAVVLDLGLPDRDGMELLSSLRTFEPLMPVLILSARDSVEHRLQGLRGGADDYMIKPFDLRELAARLDVLVRRTQGRTVQTIKAGPLLLEPDNGLAWFDHEPVVLSRREIDLLAYLANADGRWLTPDTLRERLYGLVEEIHSNALNVHIYNIRQKLGNKSIETARGLGYRLGWRLSP